MTDSRKETPNRIDRLIDFLKSLGRVKKQKLPGPDEADYSSWKQTEEEYQKEQAEWLEKVEKKKAEKKR